MPTRTIHPLARAAATVALGVLCVDAWASAITVDRLFRFNRTDTYAVTGENTASPIVDNGLFTVRTGSSCPTGTLGSCSGTGLMTSSMRNEASVSGPTGSADAVAFVNSTSNFEATGTSLDFSIAATLGTEAATTGDGLVSSSVFSNGRRTFSFINYITEFRTTQALNFDLSGATLASSGYSFRSLDSGFTDVAGTSGTIGPGRYEFRLTRSIEYRAGTNASSSQTHDIRLQLAATPVSEPSVLGLLAVGLLMVVRRRAAR